MANSGYVIPITYNERVSEATVHNCAIIFDTDRDFKHVPTLEIQSDEGLNQIVTNPNTHGGSLIYDDLTFGDVDSMSDDDRPTQLQVGKGNIAHKISDVAASQLQ